MFFECTHTNEIHRQVLEQFIPELRCDSEIIRKELFLYGSYNDGTNNQKLFLRILIGLVQNFIWECKLKKQKLAWNNCKNFCYENLDTMLRVSRELFKSKNVLNLTICRRWHRG
jgi:hypothetical protein